MASSELRDNDSESRANTAVSSDAEAEAAELVGSGAKDDRARRRFPSSRIIGVAERDRMIAEARKVDFAIGLRGYERSAVDQYVERVNRLLAELEMSSSPESAVRHALDEVSEETRDILQRAHQTADEITARSRAKADDRLEQAEHDAEEIVKAAQQDASDVREAAQREARETRDAVQREAQELREGTTAEAQNLRETAHREVGDLRETTMREMTELRETCAQETQRLRATADREADEMRGNARREADEMTERAENRTRELIRNVETVWLERRRLIDDMRAVGDQLLAISDAEAKRFQHLDVELPSGEERAAEQAATTVSEPVPTPQEAAKT
jgi:cell division septum initiation protein DivIVA